jgi:hypothetical protein
MHLYKSIFIDVENRNYVATKYQDPIYADYRNISNQCKRQVFSIGKELG